MLNHAPTVSTTSPHRWLTCPRWKRNMLRLVPGGATVMCGSCNEPHFYSRDEINTMWDQLEREQEQKAQHMQH